MTIITKSTGKGVVIYVGLRQKYYGSKRLEEVKEMRWIIKVYIPVDCDEPEIFNCKEDAEKEIESLNLMQPENIYKIEEIER